MKRSLLILIISLLTCLWIIAQPVDYTCALKAANAMLAKEGNDKFIIHESYNVRHENSDLFFVFNLLPQGYIIISGDTDLPPVLAFSFTDNYFNALIWENPLQDLLIADVVKKIKNRSLLPVSFVNANHEKWNTLPAGRQEILNSDIQKLAPELLDQWPPAGTTPTGGWLQDNWTQSAPYNNYCPMDHTTNQRSLAGCPAVAMAMIMNFHKTTNSIQFSDNDDYQHNYSGNIYVIDNDCDSYDFPCFPDLNNYLDTLEQHYINNVSITNNDRATLVFACGVAATQVFASAGSGTFSVSQALAAYQRFDCTTATLLSASDTGLYSRLTQNMKDTLPAHLAVVDQSWSTGHNVVADGYRSDGYYHLNFGWGGSYNGWYLIPSGIPYNLTVIEGLIVDILKNPSVSVSDFKQPDVNIIVYPNPANDCITLQFLNPENRSYTLVIYNAKGQIVRKMDDIKNAVRFDNTGMECGFYFFRLQNNSGIAGYGKFIIE
ncbi:MAG: thiol protease/hemagglutinin PrtT [Bacteroidia bacterium]|nr:thiol protease/hemagglutinin PrtT [Bacteroidia bacterium]